MVHTASLMLKVTGVEFDVFPGAEILYAILFALGFDMAIITFSINGKSNYADGLAWIVFFFNLTFLNYDFLEPIGQKPMADILEGYSLSRFPITLLFSGTAAWIIHRYVLLFTESIGDNKKKMELFGVVEDLKRKLKGASADIEKLEIEKSDLTDEVNQQKAELASREARIELLSERQPAAVADASSILFQDLKPEVLKAEKLAAERVSNGNGKLQSEEKRDKIKCNYCPRTFPSTNSYNASKRHCDKCQERKKNKEGEYAD
jgi:hypothetical protein